jgi:hypothetical protein
MCCLHTPLSDAKHKLNAPVIFWKKKGGRPATGHDPMVGLRMSKAKRVAVKKWASTQHDKPNFSEAVRRLIDIGLKSLDEYE